VADRRRAEGIGCLRRGKDRHAREKGGKLRTEIAQYLGANNNSLVSNIEVRLSDRRLPLRSKRTEEWHCLGDLRTVRSAISF